MTPDKTGAPSKEAERKKTTDHRSFSTVSGTEAPVTGILENARIIAARGPRLVQDLRPGDLVISRQSGVVAIERIEQISLASRAVYVIAGTFGHRQTDKDTLLPADQPVLVRDWRARAFAGRPELIMRARSLTDGEYVRDIGIQPMTLYRLYCARPEVLYADGMELGTADCDVGCPERMAHGTAAMPPARFAKR